MEPHFRNNIEAIRYQLERANEEPQPTARLGMTMIVVGQLTDLVERLYGRILNLERVQNERGEVLE